MDYEKIGSREMTHLEKEHMSYISNLMKIVNEEGDMADQEARRIYSCYARRL